MHPRIIIPAIVFTLLASCQQRPSAHQEGSEPTADPSQWVVEQMPGGTVKVAYEAMEIEDRAGCTIWFKRKLTAPVEIEYDVTVVSKGGPSDRVSDVNCFWMANERGEMADVARTVPRKRSGRFSEYHTLLTYYTGMGGNNNTTTRFRRYDGTGERPLMAEHDLRGQEVLLAPNTTYRIRLVARDGVAEFWRDGKRIFSFKDPQPLKTGWFGFRTVNSHLRISRFRIHHPAQADHARQEGQDPRCK
jgi:hypothetical protein